MSDIPIDKQLKMACRHCRSENVLLDACASWDFEKQEWVLDNTFDEGYCPDCEERAEIEEISMMDLLLGVDNGKA